MPKIFLIVLLLPFYCLSQNNYILKGADTLKLATWHQRIPMPDGDSLDTYIVLDTTITQPQPTIMMYSIYPDEYNVRRARNAALYGYASVMVNTRGKVNSNSDVKPFEHDAADAWYVLEWISSQPWCNKKIGMYGGSYLGFSQWAAAKSGHPALKTIVPQVAVGPGVDFPMQNGIFSNYALHWLRYVTNTKKVDDDAFNNKRSFASTNTFYRKELPFRKLDSINGTPNSLFQKWLDNPVYNEFWKSMAPYREDYAKINIPILTITGYFDVDQAGALNYYREHLKHNNNAKHYLVMGPYSHFGAQGKPDKEFMGYTIDDVADININNMVFEWFDYILKGKEKPPFLKDKLNLQVMDTDTWQHSQSLSAAAPETLKFYLAPGKSKEKFSLSEELPVANTIPLTVDFKERKRSYDLRSNNSMVISRKLETRTGLQFFTEPLAENIIINGSFGGELNATINKKDMDILVELFELREDGTYFDLSYYFGRASHAKDCERRQLLRPGVKEVIPINNSRYTAKKISKGSRLVVCISISKSPHYQVNYGTGKDVSDETIADAFEPLKILWHTDSFISIPINKKPLN